MKSKKAAPQAGAALITTGRAGPDATWAGKRRSVYTGLRERFHTNLLVY
jgi:hypothetical protein